MRVLTTRSLPPSTRTCACVRVRVCVGDNVLLPGPHLDMRYGREYAQDSLGFHAGASMR